MAFISQNNWFVLNPGIDLNIKVFFDNVAVTDRMCAIQLVMVLRRLQTVGAAA